MQELINLPFDDIGARITIQLEQKYRALNDYVEGQPIDIVLQVRIQQLAISKVLVNIHGKTPLILARAHGNLGESYLESEYYDQALDHLTTALVINGELMNTFEQTKHFQTHILTLIGKCHLQDRRPKDSLYFLDKALEMNKNHLGEEHITNAIIYSQLAKTYTSLRQFQEAINALSAAWELNQGTFGMNSEQTGSIYLELGKVSAKKRDFQKAIDYQAKAFWQSPQKIAGMAAQLSEWNQLAGQLDEALRIMKQAQSILEYNLGTFDKKTVKAKRDISLLLLKLNKYDQALDELICVQELEKKIFGQFSIQVGRTYKVIGTLYIIKNSIPQARDFLIRALKIFQQRCSLNLAKEVKAKLRIVGGGVSGSSKMSSKETKKGDMSQGMKSTDHQYSPNHSKATSFTPIDTSPTMFMSKSKKSHSKVRKPRIQSAHPANRKLLPSSVKASTTPSGRSMTKSFGPESPPKIKLGNFMKQK